jgi:hypothetical protein
VARELGLRWFGASVYELPAGPPVSYVSCYDLAGRVLHAWWPDGEHRVYRVKDRPEERVNRAELMARVAPTLDINQMQLVRYQEVRE